jgi:hypothetical protein
MKHGQCFDIINHWTLDSLTSLTRLGLFRGGSEKDGFSNET